MKDTYILHNHVIYVGKYLENFLVSSIILYNHCTVGILCMCVCIITLFLLPCDVGKSNMTIQQGVRVSIKCIITL